MDFKRVSKSILTTEKYLFYAKNIATQPTTQKFNHLINKYYLIILAHIAVYATFGNQ